MASSPAEVPVKKKMTVGFSHVGVESAWRRAQIESIRSEAAKRGIDLRVADAQVKQENQIRDLVAFTRANVDVIVIVPVVEAGWEPVLPNIKAAGIPVVFLERAPADCDPTLYTAVLAPGFKEQGRRAGLWLARKTAGQAKIAEIRGIAGTAPAIERGQGFHAAIAAFPGMKVVAAQSGEFTRASGKLAMRELLKTADGRHINAVYAHNDDMALGAIEAITEAGLRPGRDVVIVSIDGMKSALQAIVAGTMNCTVEYSPAIGPQLLNLIESVAAGKPVAKTHAIEDRVYDDTSAAAALRARTY